MKVLKNGEIKKLSPKTVGTKRLIRKPSNEEEDFNPLFQREKIDERSKFELAKYVLLAIVFFYISLVAVVLYLDPAEYIKEVWTVSICLINTIMGMIIGYYFGKR